MNDKTKPEAQAAGEGVTFWLIVRNGGVEFGQDLADLPTPASHDAQPPVSAGMERLVRAVTAAQRERDEKEVLSSSTMGEMWLALEAIAQQPAVVGDAEVARYWRDRAQRAEALSFSMSPGPGPQKGCRLDAAGNPMREVSPGVWQSALAWPDAALTPAATPGDKQGRDAAQVIRDALAYVNVRTDGDLLALADRAENWIRESRVLIDMQAKLIAAQKEGNGNG